MAIGQVVLVQSGTSNQVAIPSGNYPWPTIRILNPNDGVCYVKQNGPCTGSGYGSWDYKVPSQSFGLLPGGGEGWQSVGLYYIDQSGANRPGELTIYLTQQQATEPVFQAIGRAIVSQSSSVDIASGAQPAAPGAGYGRLWIDTGGHLNIAQPAGTNFVVLDSTNCSTYVQPLINATALGGDLAGTIASGFVELRNNSTVTATDTGGGVQRLLGVLGDNNSYLFLGSGGILYFYSDYGTAGAMATLTDAGNFSTTAAIIAGTNVTVTGGSIYIPDANHYMIESSDYLYMRFPNGVLIQAPAGGWAPLQCGPLTVQGGASFASNITAPGITATTGFYASNLDIQEVRTLYGMNNSIYLTNNGSMWTFHGAVSIDSTLTVPTLISSGAVWSYGAQYFLGSSGSYYITLTSTNVMYAANMNFLSGGYVAFSANTGINWSWNGTELQSTHPLNCPSYIRSTGQHTAYNGWNNTNLNAFLAPNVANYTGQALAQQWGTWSAKEYKADIHPIEDPVTLVLNDDLHGVAYNHIHPQDATVLTPSIGFVADEWLPYVPEVVMLDEDGKITGMDYARIGAITFEALKDYMQATNARLDKLEAVSAE